MVSKQVLPRKLFDFCWYHLAVPEFAMLLWLCGSNSQLRMQTTDAALPAGAILCSKSEQHLHEYIASLFPLSLRIPIFQETRCIAMN